MTDRELLELAAKAAGLKINVFESWAVLQEVDGKDQINGRDAYTQGSKAWKPLQDDGDALRLAVKLSLHVAPRTAEVWRDCKEIEHIFEDGEDEYAATRRAIVRAAAELGKNV